MKAKILGISMLCSTLFGAPAKEGPALQELRLEIEHTGYKMHSHDVEIELLHEKLTALDKKLADLRKELGKSPKDEGFGKRISQLEKSHEALISDLKMLRESLSASAGQIAALEKKMGSELKGVKDSLGAVVALLKGEEAGGKSYVVKEGDSLGKIASDHHVPISRLKELNHLSSDRIFPGQRLLLNH